MTQLVVVQPAAPGTTVAGYDFYLGPLRFTCPLDPLSETLGDGLDAVGAALVPAERKPRPLKLKLPVRAYHREVDPTQIGLRMRRQVRQLLENARWRMGGLYVYWAIDADLDGWLLIGGGDLTESDPGITFGDFELELSDVFLVGRPGTHKPGRRLDLADRRGGQVPRDTRGTLYSTDFATQALPTEPLVIPGDVVSTLGAQNRLPASQTAGLQKGTRRLWRTVAASNGEAVSYLPDPVLTPDKRTSFQDIDELGSVRLWDLSTATVLPPNPDAYARVRDDAPDVYYGWERVFGDVLTADKPLAMGNGACRVVWLGPAAGQGLAVEYHDASIDAMHRVVTVLHALNVTEIVVVEITPERGVLELRAADKALRVVLQRGWWGPRLESYNDSGGNAALEIADAYGGTITVGAAQTPSWVDRLDVAPPALLTNELINPSAETNTNGWTSAAALTSSAAWAVAGTKGLRAILAAVTNNDVSIFSDYVTRAPGEPVSARATLHPLNTFGGNARLRVEWWDATSLLSSADSTVQAGMAGGTTLEFTIVNAVAPAGTTRYRMRLIVATVGTQNVDVLWDAMLAAKSATLPAYFDGDSLNADWTGAAHASTSVLRKVDSSYLLLARGTNDMTRDNNPVAIAAPAMCYRRARTVVAQIAPPPGPAAAALASLSLVDARPAPVLVARPRS